MSIQDIKSMPKIDLHCHIDGSFSPAFVREISHSTLDDNALKEKLQASSSCESLTEYLTKFDLPIACMQTKDNIISGILDIASQAKEENITYLELRFAPTCSVNPDLSYRDIFEACERACKLAFSKYGIYINIIVCAMRHHSLETNLAMLHASREFLGNGICALDLAGDENHFKNDLFYKLFQEANRLEMPFTIHSGECGSIENVRLSMEFGAKRIGHGIALMKDMELAKEIAKKQIGIELCPTSNYQTKAVSKEEEYPLRRFLDCGIKVCINTDNRTVSNTTMTKEYELIINRFHISYDELKLIYKYSVDLAFASDAIKHELLKRI